MLRNECSVSFDASSGSLIYKGADADEHHWDAQWSRYISPETVRTPDRFVVAETNRNLPIGAKILDAGCGLARTVWGLHQAGYDAHGVDFAPDTVRLVKDIAPELRVIEADVRNMPFDSDYFDGVWSLGVVEHFPGGFAEIVNEMRRVTKPGGLCFVTAPTMSPLRRLKARLGHYPAFDGDFRDFYQFVMEPQVVISEFERGGWRYVGGKPRGGFKGLKDECRLLSRWMQAIYDSRTMPARMARSAIDRVLAPISHHTRLYRFAKL